MGLMSEFKEFAVKGNVVDMAVGIIIGAAFGKIVGSLVGDVILPPIGLLMGGVDFANLQYILQPAVDGQEAVTIKYGLFIQTILDFIILAFCIFIGVKAINSMKKKEDEESSGPSQEELLIEIRDLLAKQKL